MEDPGAGSGAGGGEALKGRGEPTACFAGGFAGGGDACGGLNIPAPILGVTGRMGVRIVCSCCACCLGCADTCPRAGGAVSTGSCGVYIFSNHAGARPAASAAPSRAVCEVFSCGYGKSCLPSGVLSRPRSMRIVCATRSELRRSLVVISGDERGLYAFTRAKQAHRGGESMRGRGTMEKFGVGGSVHASAQSLRCVCECMTHRSGRYDELALAVPPCSPCSPWATAYDHALSRVCLNALDSGSSCSGRGASKVPCFSRICCTRRWVSWRRALSRSLMDVPAAADDRVDSRVDCCVWRTGGLPAPLSRACCLELAAPDLGGGDFLPTGGGCLRTLPMDEGVLLSTRENDVRSEARRGRSSSGTAEPSGIADGVAQAKALRRPQLIFGRNLGNGHLKTALTELLGATSLRKALISPRHPRAMRCPRPLRCPEHVIVTDMFPNKKPSHDECYDTDTAWVACSGSRSQP